MRGFVVKEGKGFYEETNNFLGLSDKKKSLVFMDFPLFGIEKVPRELKLKLGQPSYLDYHVT